VRLTAKPSKAAELENFLRDGLSAVLEEPDTSTWYAVRFSEHEFAIFDTFTGNAGRLAHLAGKVGRGLITHGPELLDELPEIEHADVLAFKLTNESGQVQE